MSLYLQLIEAAYANPDQAKYMNKEKIEPYRGTGGVSNHYYRGTGGVSNYYYRGTGKVSNHYYRGAGGVSNHYYRGTGGVSKTIIR